MCIVLLVRANSRGRRNHKTDPTAPTRYIPIRMIEHNNPLPEKLPPLAETTIFIPIRLRRVCYRKATEFIKNVRYGTLLLLQLKINDMMLGKFIDCYTMNISAIPMSAVFLARLGPERALRSSSPSTTSSSLVPPLEFRADYLRVRLGTEFPTPPRGPRTHPGQPPQPQPASLAPD